MKKKILYIIGLSSLVAFSACAAVSANIAWFLNRAVVEDGLIAGSSIGAYFGGGDGSAEHPYKIMNSTHLYNLAWLQFLGTFNKKAAETNNLEKQFYFTLENDIDMRGLVIPPIGTQEQPFLGNFNGQGHTIYNFSTSNTTGNNDIKRKPSIVSASDLSDVQIVGFFGVVGDLTTGGTGIAYSSATNEIKNFGLEDFTIRTSTSQSLVGLAAGYVNGTVTNVAIDESNFYVKSGTNPIQNGSAYPYGNKLSNYGTVGYCEDDYLKTTKIVDIQAEQPTMSEAGAADAGNNWGASLPMSDIYNGISQYRTQATRVQYASASYHYYDQNGNELTNLYQETMTNVPQQSNGSVYYQFRDKQLTNAAGQDYASYSYAYRVQNNSDAVYLEQYTYLYGATQHTMQQTRHNFQYENTAAYYIFDGTNYLSANATPAITNATTQASATKWAIDGNYLYIQVVDDRTATNYYLTYNGQLRLTTTRTTQWTYANNEYSCTYNNNTYYLRYNNGWTCTTTSPYNVQGTGKYYIHTGTNYLTANNNHNGYTNATTEANATAWETDGTYYYITYNNQRYYINSTASNGRSLTLTTGTNNRYYKNGNYLYNGSAYVRYNNGWTYNRYQYNATTLTFTEQTEQIGDPTFTVSRSSTTVGIREENTSNVNTTYETKPTYIPLKYEVDNSGNPTDVSTENTGYIVSGGYYNASGNTAGDIRVSRYAFSGNLNNTFANGNTGQSSYTSNTAKYFEVITRNAKSNGYKRISDEYNKTITSGFNGNISGISKVDLSTFGFEKYDAARQSFDISMVGENRTGSQSNMYGLHFMDANININHKISVERASVQGVTYQYNEALGLGQTSWQEYKLDDNGDIVYDDENNPVMEDHSGYVAGKYEMLEDCIDFKLNKNGTINFFSGTYFGNNDAFFSLNQVFRNNTISTTTIDSEEVEVSHENEIVNVKEIYEVWTNTDYRSTDINPKPKYLYKYSDGKWSQNDGTVSEGTSKPSNAGELVFDTGWITGRADDFNMITNACYYFEIPVVTGEYALGSVDGRLGAYLLYLDIGASNVNDEKMVVKEKITTKTDYYTHPKGVAFATITSGTEYTFNAVTGDEVGTVVIPTGVSGDIAFTLSGANLTCGPPTSGSLSESTYKNIDATIKTGSADLTVTRSDWKEVTEDKTSTYSYDRANEKMYVTYTSRITTKTMANPTGTVRTESKLVDDVGYTVTASEYDNTKYVEYRASDADKYVELKYSVDYEESGGEEVENVTFTYEVKYNASDEAFTYEFVFTSTQDITIKVIALKSRIVSSNETYKLSINGTICTVGSTVNIAAS